MVVAQEWIDFVYTLARRQVIKKLNINQKNFTGSLKLTDFSQLEELYCERNQLTSLIINNCPNLRIVDCYDNQLTKLDVRNCEKLTSIDCWSNQLTNLDLPQGLSKLSARNNQLTKLTIFSQLENLKELYLIDNPFTASLECLPTNLEKLYCNGELAKELEKLGEPNGNDYIALLKVWRKWKNQGFTAEEIQEWISIGVKSDDYEFADYLKKERSFTPQQIASDRLVELKNQYNWWQKNFTLEKRKEWISVGFQPNDYENAQKWKSFNFNAQKAKLWIKVGAKVDDHEFVAWLRDIKKCTHKWITNYQEDYQLLSERFKKYGLCPECNQPNTGEQWCKSCNNSRLQQDFANWTSNNSKIDKFIQQYQLQATEAAKFLEWIPYKQFKNIQYLAEGGFSKVYKAQWTAGNIHHWDQENKQWQREKDQSQNYREAVLKILTNSQNNTDFLQETANHKTIDDWFNNIVPCYGISQDTKGNYLMVMQYMPEGNLRNYLRKNNRELKKNDNELKAKSAKEKELSKEIEKIKLENNQLESEIKTEKDRSDQINKNLTVIKEKLIDVDANINQAQQDLNNVNNRAKRNKINGILKQNEEEKDKLKKDLADTEDKLIETEERLDNLINKLQSNQEQLQKKNQELNKLRSEVVDLQAKLNSREKFNQLVNISRGLKDIHQKNLVHHDFHSGNILKGMEKTACLITDLGLCKPANETSQEKVFGVLPYVAPEVLKSQPYTQAADIYSFGMVAYELLTGLPPYYDRVHDVKLGIEICQGLRPKFQIKVPSLLEDLINHCWDANPQNRPVAHELERILRNWEQGNTEFNKQLQVAEAFNQLLPDNIKFPNYQIHRGAVYHSQLLPTKEITQFLQNFNLQTKTLELNEQLIKVKELATEIKMEQKYNDLKKALKLLFEKSEELEKIAISEELKEVITKIKELKHNSQEKDSAYQELAKKKTAKERELKELKQVVITNNHLEEDELEDILIDQEQAIKNANEKITKKLERTKKRLTEKVSEVEINHLCQLQTEITKLELELNKNIDQSTKQLTQIITNIGSINIEQGDAIIGNTFGDQNTITYNSRKSMEVDSSPKKPRKRSSEDNSEVKKPRLEIEDNWANINSAFSNQQLVEGWLDKNFTYQEVQDWASVFGQQFNPQEVNFCTWLRDTKQLIAEQCLNKGNLEQLKTEYNNQLTAQIIQLPKK